MPGKINIIPDLLSRHPAYEQNERAKPDEIVIAFTKIQKFSDELAKSLKSISNLQAQERTLKAIKDNSYEFDETTEQERPKFTIKNGILYRKDRKQNYRVIVPQKLIEKLIRETHEAYGHIGQRKLNKLLEEAFYIKNLRHKVCKILAYCDTCQRNKHCTRSSVALQQTILAKRPNELLDLDFMGPWPTSRGGMKNVLVAIDAFTKYVTIYPIKSQRTKTALNKLINDYFVKYGKVHLSNV